MWRFAVLLFTFVIFCSTQSAQAKTEYTDKGEVPVVSNGNIEDEAKLGLDETLDVWRDGKYDLLFERTHSRGKHTKESFIKTLSNTSRKPACCWEKMQDVKVTVKSNQSVTLTAKIGIEEMGRSTAFTTRSLKLVKEDGAWRMSISDILSLAGGSKKKGAKAHHKKKK